MISTISPNDPRVDQLRNMYATCPTAKPLLDYLGRRQRDWSELTIDHLLRIVRAEGVTVHRSQGVGLIKDLAEMGLGQMILGRGQKGKTRLVWHYSPKAIGRAAAGTQEDIPELPESDSTTANGRLSNTGDAASSDHLNSDDELEIEFIPHEMQLRPDLAIQIELPVDLTNQEANRLSLFVRAIPFDGGDPRTFKRAC